MATPMMKKTSRYVSPTVRVSVTEDIILESKMSDSSHCMIAEAIKVALPKATYVSVDLATIRFTDPDKGLRYTYFTPKIAQVALLNFDQGHLPNPFTFQIRSAGQIRKAGWKAGQKVGTTRAQLSERHRQLRKKKKKFVKGVVQGGRAIPRMGSRRAYGLRAFILGGAVGKGGE